MKKHYTNSKNIISIYRYMEICGLECKFKKNVRVSHSIMEKKLNLRHGIFPEEVLLPVRVSFDDYINEDVLSGKIIEVIDDYNKVLAYRNPLLMRKEELLNSLIKNADKKTLKRIREDIIEASGYNVSVSGKIEKNEEEYTEPEITEKINRQNMYVESGNRKLVRKKNGK